LKENGNTTHTYTHTQHTYTTYTHFSSLVLSNCGERERERQERQERRERERESEREREREIKTGGRYFIIRLCAVGCSVQQHCKILHISIEEVLQKIGQNREVIAAASRGTAVLQSHCKHLKVILSWLGGLTGCSTAVVCSPYQVRRVPKGFLSFSFSSLLSLSLDANFYHHTHLAGAASCAAHAPRGRGITNSPGMARSITSTGIPSTSTSTLTTLSPPRS